MIQIKVTDFNENYISNLTQISVWDILDRNNNFDFSFMKIWGYAGLIDTKIKFTQQFLVQTPNTYFHQNLFCSK